MISFIYNVRLKLERIGKRYKEMFKFGVIKTVFEIKEGFKLF